MYKRLKDVQRYDAWLYLRPSSCWAGALVHFHHVAA